MTDKSNPIEYYAELMEEVVAAVKPDATYRWRKMFGGAGYYADDVMFSGWYGDDVGFAIKLNETDRETLLQHDGTTPGMSKDAVVLSDDIINNHETLREWVLKSITYCTTKPKKKK